MKCETIHTEYAEFGGEFSKSRIYDLYMKKQKQIQSQNQKDSLQKDAAHHARNQKTEKTPLQFAQNEGLTHQQAQ